MVLSFFSKLKQKYILLAPTRYYRVERYLQMIENKLSLKNEKEKKQADEIRGLIEEKIIKIKRLNKIIITIYIALYFSFISFFLGDFVFVEEISQIISSIISIFGTTIFIILAFILHRMAELHYQDLNLLSSHLISLYEDKGKIENIYNMEKKMNSSKIFLDFFKQPILNQEKVTNKNKDKKNKK